jgi:dTDP-4-dehydrorhamnose 3,5-epimerase
LKAWGTNVAGVAALARVTREHRITLVHVSSDYVFDGSREIHTEEESFSPLGVYGQTKAAGDAVVGSVPQHYIVRTSWVVGEGSNFVRTMVQLADKGVCPAVVNDQTGRLTFAEDLAAALHLLSSRAPFGTYNVTNSGESQTWADIASDVYEMCGRDRSDVSGVSTAQYFANKPSSAPRPRNSTLDLSKISSSGFVAPSASRRLKEYVDALRS